MALATAPSDGAEPQLVWDTINASIKEPRRSGRPSNLTCLLP